MNDVQQDIQLQAGDALKVVIAEMESRVAELDGQYKALIAEAAKAYARLRFAQQNQGFYEAHKARGRDTTRQLVSDLERLQHLASEWAKDLEIAKAELEAHKGFARQFDPGS